jgi:hypothetical protein
MSENFIGIFSKLIRWTIYSKTPILLRKNSDLNLLWNKWLFFPWNNSNILLDFVLSNHRGFKLEIFLRNFSDGKNSKLLRKGSHLSYLRVETCNKQFFWHVTIVENFDKICLTLSKENQKSQFKPFCFGRSKSPFKRVKLNKQ